MDTTFKKFLTPTLIKIIWVICIAFATLFGVVGLLSSIAALITEGNRSSANWLLPLIAPIAAVLWLLFVRVALELIIVIFRIAENTAKMVPPNITVQPPMVAPYPQKENA